MSDNPIGEQELAIEELKRRLEEAEELLDLAYNDLVEAKDAYVIDEESIDKIRAYFIAQHGHFHEKG